MFELKRMAVAVVANAALAAASYAVGAVNVAGVGGGVVVGVVILYCGGWGAFALLGAFFVLGSAATRLGYRKKAGLGVAQEDRGRRGAKHAFANCGAPAIAAVIFWGGTSEVALWPQASWALAAFAGAFATALFDTVSSEIGQLYGRRPFLITTLKAVPVGTDGAVSLEGTLAGLGAGALVAGLGAGLGLYGWMGAAFVTLGAFIGTTFESIIGARGRAKKRINNELLNFLNTLVGAAAAGVLFFLFAR